MCKGDRQVFDGVYKLVGVSGVLKRRGLNQWKYLLQGTVVLLPSDFV